VIDAMRQSESAGGGKIKAISPPQKWLTLNDLRQPRRPATHHALAG